MKAKTAALDVKGSAITVRKHDGEGCISLTDIARHKNADRTDDLVRNWLRNRNAVEFLGPWKQLNNAAFNPVEFDGIKTQVGLNSFAPEPEAMEQPAIIAIRQMQALTARPTAPRLKE